MPPTWSAASAIRKDADEIAAMRKAVKVAQTALEATIPLIKTGMTEKELASELVVQLLRHGSQSEMPFAPIVSSGPNSANPHATPSDRKIRARRPAGGGLGRGGGRLHL